MFANDAECKKQTDGTYTFEMPQQDVSLKATFDVLSVPETDDGLRWTDYDQLTTSAVLSGGVSVDFGSELVNSSCSTTADGYSTMIYAKVISTNQKVLPDEAVRRIDPVRGSNGAYATGALISFDVAKIAEGKTQLYL